MEASNTIEQRVRDLVADEFLDGSVEIRPLEQTRALWTKHDGSSTKFHELGGKFCAPSKILDVCGRIAVGDDGKVQFKLTDFVCIPPPAPGANFERIIPPAFVVATARSNSPIHTTAQASVRDDEVLIAVFAWDTSGAPVPKVFFDWRCCVPLVEVFG